MASRAQAFRDWVISEGLTTTGPIDQLQDTRLVIDAEDFLENILTTRVSREPLLPALGGLPFALRKHVDDHIANFKEANITPTFIFNGLDLACKDRSTISRESKLAARSLDEAWNLYSQSRADEAVAEFGKSCMQRSYVWRFWCKLTVNRHLPYLSHPSLAPIAPSAPGSQSPDCPLLRRRTSCGTRQGELQRCCFRLTGVSSIRCLQGGHFFRL